VKHPVLKARYADVAWEISGYRRVEKLSTKRVDYKTALIAVESYLDAVERGIVTNVYRAFLFIGRAIQLAAGLKDQLRVDRAKALLFRFRDELEARDPNAPFWLFNRIAWEQQKALQFTTQERGKIVSVLERALALRSDKSQPETFDPITANDIADRSREWRIQSDEHEENVRASKTAASAIEVAAKDASALTAIAWLGGVAETYRRDGDEAGAARVERTIRARSAEAKNELQVHEHTFEIPREKIEAFVDAVSGDSLSDGMKKVALACLIREQSTVDSMLEEAKQAAFFSHIPITIMRDDGFSGASIGSVERDPEGRKIYHASRAMGMSAPWVNMAFAGLREKHSLSLETFTEWLAGCQLFTPARSALVQEGLAAWFAGDPVRTIHVLVPQVEAAMRELLIRLGGAVTQPARYGGGTTVMGMGAILEHERIQQGVPADIIFHLRVLYTDLRGLNIRNEFAHGLASPELFDRGLANWVVHSIVLLGLLRIKHKG
jgi:hypothetical protein